MQCVAEAPLNMKQACAAIREAASDGAQIVTLPELFLTRYFCQTIDPAPFALAEPIPGPTTVALSALAQELGIVIVSSIFEHGADGRYFNTAAVCDADGTYLGKYRKTHIPHDLTNHYGENHYFAAGDLGYPVFNTRFGLIGVLVCWDQWFPEAARILALKGAQIIFYPTAIGYQTEGPTELNQTERDAWQTVQRGQAIANTIFVAAANRVGKEGQLDFWGSSFVSDPAGRVLATADDHSSTVVIATCDLSEIDRVRRDWPFLACRRADLFGPLVKNPNEK